MGDHNPGIYWKKSEANVADADMVRLLRAENERLMKKIQILEDRAQARPSALREAIIHGNL